MRKVKKGDASTSEGSMDYELEKLKRKKLLELRRRPSVSPRREGETKDPREVLKDILIGRAWEVYRAAWSQFPGVMPRVERALISAIRAGRIRNKINGESLYLFLRTIGLPVRLKTSIRIKEHGELKTLQEKFKEV